MKNTNPTEICDGCGKEIFSMATHLYGCPEMLMIKFWRQLHENLRSLLVDEEIALNDSVESVMLKAREKGKMD
jgi:hypothetical protein